MFDSPIAQYRIAGGRIVTLCVVGGFVAAAVGLLVPSPIGVQVAVGFAVPLLLWAVWARSVEVTVYREGLTYWSKLSSKTFRWIDLEEVKHSAVDVTVNFIPQGTYYSLSLRDSFGQRLRISDGGQLLPWLFRGVSRVDELIDHVVRLSFEPLSAKFAARYSAGAVLRFGAIDVNRQAGITERRFLRTRRILWHEYSGYTVTRGFLFLFKVSDKRVAGTKIADVANFEVLVALLDRLKQPAAKSGERSG